MPINLKPLQQWYCDVCGEVIECPEDGYVVWSTKDLGGVGRFKIIHHIHCDRNPDREFASHSLKTFLGPDGLIYVLSFLGPDVMNLGIPDMYGDRIVDVGNLVELIRRTQVPYYEEARRIYMEDAEVQDLFYDSNDVAPYSQETMCEVLERHELTDNAVDDAADGWW